MRAVEDHHVDRLEVEAQQCVERTSTNCSIGLILRCSWTAIASPPCVEAQQVRMSLRFCVARAERVVIARVPHPFPSRTRPLSPSAPMVLCLKAWESRSPPAPHVRHNPPFTFVGLASPRFRPGVCHFSPQVLDGSSHRADAGWSSPVARQAHNLKVVGSNPTPAPKLNPRAFWPGVFCVLACFDLLCATPCLAYREPGFITKRDGTRKPLGDNGRRARFAPTSPRASHLPGRGAPPAGWLRRPRRG